jgi:ribosomal protein S18 acetylase RimI-like enzyme
MGTPVTLRPARAEDARTVADIWHGAWRDAHVGHVPPALLDHRRLADFQERVPPRLPETTVAATSAGVVGFVVVREDEVEQIFVAGAARGQGVADALLEHAERVIAARFPVAWLAVVEGNARARRFYERNGWRDTRGFDYAAETRDGTLPVPCRRYEKPVRRANDD